MIDSIEIPESFFVDNELSLQAVGLLCFLTAYSKNNKIKKTEIYDVFPKNKKGSVSTAWLELVRNRYLLQIKTRNRGKWDSDYYFSFHPFSDSDIEKIIERRKSDR